MRTELCPIKRYSDMDANSLSEQVPLDHTGLASEQVSRMIVSNLKGLAPAQTLAARYNEVWIV